MLSTEKELETKRDHLAIKKYKILRKKQVNNDHYCFSIVINIIFLLLIYHIILHSLREKNIVIFYAPTFVLYRHTVKRKLQCYVFNGRLTKNGKLRCKLTS